MGDHVLLVGMMGAGKTTVGLPLAALMRRPFHDSDAEIHAWTGKSVPEIFASRGEAAFRAEERAVLARALCSDVPAVVAVAGGAVFDPDSRRRMRRGGVIVWLRARPDTLARRVGRGEGRPLLQVDPSGTLARLDSVRRPLYRSLSDVRVDVDGLSPEEIALRTLRAVNCLFSRREAFRPESSLGPW